MIAPQDNQKTPVRAFVAVPVPDAAQAGLASLMGVLGEHVPARTVRWVRPQNIHLTLRFIGNIHRGEIATLKGLLEQAILGVGPFPLQLGGAGCFPNDQNPRVLWVGLHGDLESLSRLQSRVGDATAAWGRVEARAFHPHLTLGRVATQRGGELRRLGEAIRAAPVVQGAPWRTEAVHLMQSVLEARGAQYSVLARFELTG